MGGYVSQIEHVIMSIIEKWEQARGGDIPIALAGCLTNIAFYQVHVLVIAIDMNSVVMRRFPVVISPWILFWYPQEALPYILVLASSKPSRKGMR